MIEICTKRRMILSIIGLGILTIIILILEEALTAGTQLSNGNHYSTQSHPLQSTSTKSSEVIPAPAPESAKPVDGTSNVSKYCWMTEEFQIERECSACSKFELSSGTPFACIGTGLKETLKCNKSGLAYRSCSRIAGLEKRRFLIFESLMLLFTVLGLGIVKLRRSQLERKAIKQIERRLASGY